MMVVNMLRFRYLGCGFWRFAPRDGDPWNRFVFRLIAFDYKLTFHSDLSPIQPRWVPHNVRFEVDDFTEDWVFSEPFDFIHIRNLIGSAIKDWTALYKKIYEYVSHISTPSYHS